MWLKATWDWAVKLPIRHSLGSFPEAYWNMHMLFSTEPLMKWEYILLIRTLVTFDRYLYLLIAAVESWDDGIQLAQRHLSARF
jgi:hypothetical protein